MPALYIADGHHRSAAAALVGAEKAQQNANHQGNEEYNYFMDGCFLNMTMDDDQFVMWRAVLEGIGYDYMALADTYRKAGVDLNRLTVTEGGSRNPLWNQIKSNMLNANVVRFKNAGGAVLTNCIVASFAVGDTKDIREALSANITQDAQYAPDEKLSHRYRQLFEMRNHLVRDDMKAAFHRLVEMRNID